MTASAGSLAAQRKVTAAFIADDPTTITLIPRTRVQTASGGFTQTDGTPRAPQTVKLSELNFGTPPVVTIAGVERIVDYHLIGPWDMDIATGDYWVDENGTKYEVIGFTEGWSYMRKALVSRHIPRGSVI
jgi:hypothetical protein